MLEIKNRWGDEMVVQLPSPILIRNWRGTAIANTKYFRLTPNGKSIEVFPCDTTGIRTAQVAIIKAVNYDKAMEMLDDYALS